MPVIVHPVRVSLPRPYLRSGSRAGVFPHMEGVPGPVPAPAGAGMRLSPHCDYFSFLNNHGFIVFGREEVKGQDFVWRKGRERAGLQ